MGRIGRAMIFIVALMMLVTPLASAQQATPEGGTEPPTTTESSNEGESTSLPSTGDETGTDEGTPTDDGVSEDETPQDGAADDGGTSSENGAAPDEGSGEGEAPAAGEGEIDASTPETNPSEDEETTSKVIPSSSPEMQVQNRSMAIQAMPTLDIIVETSDGGAVPDGTQICVWAASPSCQNWENSTLTFSMNSVTSDYSLTIPSGSDYASDYGTLTIPANQTPVTLTLQKKAIIEVSLAPEGAIPDGTEVCLWGADDSCRTIPGRSLTFLAGPGEIDYEVIPPVGSALAPAYGMFTVGAGESIQKTITLEAPGKVNVDVVTDDGDPLPSWVQVCLWHSLESCQSYGTDTLTFNVTPGEVEYEVDVDWNALYRPISGTMSIASGETKNVTLALESKDPAKLRVYVATEDGQPVPDGTTVCVTMNEPEFGDPVDNECQSASGSYVTFTTGQGEAQITVTPPNGSGYEGETDSFWTRMDETTRVVFELARTEPLRTGQVELIVSLEDGGVIDPNQLPSSTICLYMGEIGPLFGPGCIYGEEPTDGPDNSVIFAWSDLAPGTYNYFVATINPGYGVVKGSLTVVPDDTTRISVVLPMATDQSGATLIVDVVTLGGAPVPDGTLVCAIPLVDLDDAGEGSIEQFCQPWAGQPLTFALPSAVVLALAGLESGGMLSVPQIVALAPGETQSLTLTILPEEIEPGITHSVSTETPQSGDTVTYTIHAWGQGFGGFGAFAYEPRFDFTIENPLPVELTDVSVSCAGTFNQVYPGSCYELENGVLTVLGGVGMLGYYDITVTVTGTVVGEPGTVVSSTACLIPDMRPVMSPTNATKMASTNLYGLGMAQEFPGETPCATANLTIAQLPPTEPSSPVPTDPATPEPTGTATPTSPATPEPTGTVTPTPTTPATPEPTVPGTPAPTDPAATATPEGKQAVTALPKTGTSTGTGSSLAIYAGLAAAILLGGAGLVFRTRQANR